MYSYEIDQFLRSRNWVLTPDEYSELSPQKNPQISRCTYNTSNNTFFIKTIDGYEWNFQVLNN